MSFLIVQYFAFGRLGHGQARERSKNNRNELTILIVVDSVSYERVDDLWHWSG